MTAELQHVSGHHSAQHQMPDTPWMRVSRAHPMLMLGSRSIHQCRSHSSEQCYGEPTLLGLKQLLVQWPRADALDKRSSFLDVGSGFGRLCAFMRLHSNASSVRGIEINECRLRKAMELQQSVRDEDPSAGLLEFVLHDMRTMRDFSDATHLFAAPTCWGEQLLASIFEKAEATASLKTIVVLSRRLPPAWSSSVTQAATSWGHVGAVLPIPTTFGGASAIFFRRGPCWASSEGLGHNTTHRCWSMADVRTTAERHALQLAPRKISISRSSLQR